MRQSIESFDEQFADLHRQSADLIESLPADLLYRSSGDSGSCGELVLRSAAVVEQAFGGLTANLWDDPFEWTLPETLSTHEKIVEYLTEVETTRQRAFEALKNDEDLAKEIMTPSGNTKLLPFLLDTLERARHHQQRAKVVFDQLTVY